MPVPIHLYKYCINLRKITFGKIYANGYNEIMMNVFHVLEYNASLGPQCLSNDASFAIFLRKGRRKQTYQNHWVTSWWLQINGTWNAFFGYRADSRFAPSQWETSLQSNAVSLAGCKPRSSPELGKINPNKSLQLSNDFTFGFCLCRLTATLTYTSQVTFLKSYMLQRGRIMQGTHELNQIDDARLIFLSDVREVMNIYYL